MLPAIIPSEQDDSQLPDKIPGVSSELPVVALLSFKPSGCGVAPGNTHAPRATECAPACNWRSNNGAVEIKSISKLPHSPLRSVDGTRLKIWPAGRRTKSSATLPLVWPDSASVSPGAVSTTRVACHSDERQAMRCSSKAVACVSRLFGTAFELASPAPEEVSTRGGGGATALAACISSAARLASASADASTRARCATSSRSWAASKDRAAETRRPLAARRPECAKWCWIKDSSASLPSGVGAVPRTKAGCSRTAGPPFMPLNRRGV
mmetsp:Transcript_20365/g.57342  ORF Transcript_20365/g.57342 Transcript_20365/m.57342 type:complete len:267 (+) Transcript_20365:974-1774(+)|eukprot:scaffold56795_cov28-Tisochrysis_lutea.AAC.2